MFISSLRSPVASQVQVVDPFTLGPGVVNSVTCEVIDHLGNVIANPTVTIVTNPGKAPLLQTTFYANEISNLTVVYTLDTGEVLTTEHQVQGERILSLGQIVLPAAQSHQSVENFHFPRVLSTIESDICRHTQRLWGRRLVKTDVRVDASYAPVKLFSADNIVHEVTAVVHNGVQLVVPDFSLVDGVFTPDFTTAVGDLLEIFSIQGFIPIPPELVSCAQQMFGDSSTAEVNDARRTAFVSDGKGYRINVAKPGTRSFTGMAEVDEVLWDWRWKE